MSDAWRVWVADNLADGATDDEVVQKLIEHNVPLAVARAEVQTIADSPALALLKNARDRGRRRGMALSLLETHRELDAAGVIPVVELLEAAEFFSHYFSQSRPVVMTQAAADWPALHRWQLTAFGERFADAEIEVTTGREDGRNGEGRPSMTTVGAFVARIMAVESSNDFYAVAHGKNTARSGLSGLFDDIICPDEIFDTSRLAASTTLWLGPKGTFSPMHHDTTNVWFNQVIGRKRFRLAAPWETALLDRTDSYYLAAGTDLQALADAGAITLREVTLHPGQALFIPAGWYHEVTALDASISLSFMGFRRPNDLSWYQLDA